jgi:hypothetical protein
MVYDLIGKRAQINSSSICSTFTPMHASSSSAADAAETVAHENSAIFARLSGREAQPVVSSNFRICRWLRASRRARHPVAP